MSRVLDLVDQANGAVYAKLDAPPVGAPAELLVGTAHSAAHDQLPGDMQHRWAERCGKHYCAQPAKKE